MNTLADALPKEIERVQEIITEYEMYPGGELAAMIMRQDIRKAHESMMSGDLVGMIASYEALKTYEL
jgi:hypothetical protein